MKTNQLEQQLLLATRRAPSGELDDETRSLHQAYGGFAELIELSAEDVDAESLVDKVLAASSHGASRRSFLGGSWLGFLATAASFLLLVPLASTQWNFDRDVSHSVKAPSNAVEAAAKIELQVDEQVALAWDDDWDARFAQAEEIATAARWSSFTRLEAVQWSAYEQRSEVEAELQSGSL